MGGCSFSVSTITFYLTNVKHYYIGITFYRKKACRLEPQECYERRLVESKRFWKRSLDGLRQYFHYTRTGYRLNLGG